MVAYYVQHFWQHQRGVYSSLQTLEAMLCWTALYKCWLITFEHYTGSFHSEVLQLLIFQHNLLPGEHNWVNDAGGILPVSWRFFPPQQVAHHHLRPNWSQLKPFSYFGSGKSDACRCLVCTSCTNHRALGPSGTCKSESLNSNEYSPSFITYVSGSEHINQHLC